MHFEKTIEIDAPQQRVWDVLSDLEAWPPRIETVDVVEAMGEGRARLTLTLDMRGFLIPVIALFYKGLTNRYMNLEAEHEASRRKGLSATP
jgi:hypothetical protein